MVRPHRGARGAWCARALLLVTAAVAVAAPGSAAAGKKKVRSKKTPVSVCAHFDQLDREDDGVDLVVANRCEVKLSCSVSWTLVCAPDTAAAARSQHASAFALEVGRDQSTLASPAVCGNDGWVIDDVTWSCQPEP